VLQALENQLLLDLQSERHYGTKFKAEKIPEDVIKKLSSAEVTVEKLGNAPKNLFVP
jgi:hypothetical protein